METVDASGGRLHAKANLDDLKALDLDKVNPVTGPIHIEGAEPGDAVAITSRGRNPASIPQPQRAFAKPMAIADPYDETRDTELNLELFHGEFTFL